MRKIIIALVILSIIGLFVYYKLTNITTYKLVGYWNTMNVYTTYRSTEQFPMGFSPLWSDGNCLFPVNALVPDGYAEGHWQKIRKKGKVYIAFSTMNPFYNDTFLIAYFNITEPYSTMVLETNEKRVLLKKFPKPVGDQPSPGSDWPKEYFEKKRKEDESKKKLKGI